MKKYQNKCEKRDGELFKVTFTGIQIRFAFLNLSGNETQMGFTSEIAFRVFFHIPPAPHFITKIELFFLRAS